MKKLFFTFTLTVLWITSAYAVTATNNLGDNVIAAFYNSITQVYIPVVALGGVLFLAANCFFAFVRIGTKLAGFIMGTLILGGGISYFSSMSGGVFATTTILELSPLLQLMR